MNTEYFTKYASYKSEDFIFDKEFRELVQNPDCGDELRNLIDSLPEKRFELNIAIEVIRGLKVKKFQQSTNRKRELWQQILKQQKRHVHFTFLKYAAAIILLIGTGGTAYFFTLKSSKAEMEAINNKSNAVFEANMNDVILVLGNDKTISINIKESNLKYSEDGSEIKINDSKTICQSVHKGELNKIIVPFGKRSMLTLSDGTKVWLNSGSIFTFPPAFKNKTRDVELIGEGFFDVTHNKEKPFFVKTDAFKMKVYGTKFDIQSYKQDNASSVVLVEGKVSMRSNNDESDKEVFLVPNQRATIVDGSDMIEIDNIENADEFTSWTEGYLSFSDEDISHLLKQVSRYYNVDINVVTTKKVDKIFGKLDLKDNIEKVLDGIAYISNTNYRKNGDRYEFY